MKTIGAVSILKILGPQHIDLKLFLQDTKTSSGLNPPSGPTMILIDSRFLFLFLSKYSWGLSIKKFIFKSSFLSKLKDFSLSNGPVAIKFILDLVKSSPFLVKISKKF